MRDRIRGLAHLNKSNPKQAEWNHYFQGQHRATHRTATFPSKSLAKKFCAQHNAKMTLGLIGEIVPVSFEEAVREYLGGLMFLAKGTKCSYAITLGMFGTALGPGVVVSDITGRHIDHYQARRQAGDKKHGAVSESTLAGDIRDLSAFFHWCIKRNYHDRNPLKMATRLPARKHRRKAPLMSLELIDAVINNLDTPDRKVACAFSAMRPIDRGVLTHLHAGQVNLPESRVEFLRPKTARRAAETVILPIPPVLVAEFRSRCAQRCAGRPLFQGLSRAKKKGPQNWWWRAANAAGCPDLLFRDLRKFASSYLQTVAPASMVQHFLGHAAGDHSIMGEYYTQLFPEISQRIAALSVPGFPERQPGLRIATA